jgi:hypothetical protein
LDWRGHDGISIFGRTATPLAPLPNDPTKPDLTTARKAWWDVIKLAYAVEDNKSPFRLTLELRIMAGSIMLMAPQYGNHLGKMSCAFLYAT